jgi:cytochrome c-type biogenesis protein CcmH/NrfG
VAQRGLVDEETGMANQTMANQSMANQSMTNQGMTNQSMTSRGPGSPWYAKQVGVMAVIFLVVGLAIGYLFRGSQSPAVMAQPAIAAKAQPSASSSGGHLPSLGEMKLMADKKAAPFMEKLKGDPTNGALLVQVGNIYQSAHQFKEAIGYYGKALQLDPKNIALRTQLASCLYYDGDADRAIAQLEEGLRYDPRDANALFNLGMIKWQGKQDNKGAVAVWKQLLKSNPQLSAERKATVQKLMADVQMLGKS